MTRALLLVVPLVGALAAWLAGGTAAAVLAGLAGGAVAGVVLWGVQARRVQRLTRRLDAWVGGGSSVPVLLRGGAQWRGLGTSLNALGTQLRDTREQLGALAPWSERLVAAIDLPALLFDGDSRLLVANDAAMGLFGIQRRDEPSSPLRVLGSGPIATAVDQARTVGEPVRVTARVGERDLQAIATGLDDEVLVLVTDRSQARRVEELRRDFVTNASHELKTPVTAIATLVGALRLVEGERAERIIGQLEGEAERLVALVHDLLDLRRVDRDEGGDELAPVDLVPLVREATGRVRARADEREVAVVTRLPEAAVVVGRRTDLQLVLDNLLSNAVKYNRQGGQVTVTVTADGGHHVLAVRDTGIGIARAEVPRVFERFYRVDVARSRRTGGTGLGLSIVRHVVEGHGGTVAVESLLGAGSTFTVRLPVEPLRSGAEPRPSAHDRPEEG